VISRLIAASLFLAFTYPAQAEHRIEANVVYGVMSGMALLMDVYHPSEPIERAVVFVAGSGWDGREIGYTDYELKQSNLYYDALFRGLTDAGFTVFSVNHRMAPVHKYPAAVEDVRRAVRFVRANAERFSVSPEKIAAIGHSSGGHLSSLLGVLDDSRFDNLDSTSVASYSSRVQAVVAIAAPQDLTINSRIVAPFTASFIGDRPPMDDEFRHFLRQGTYAEASPISHVTLDDAAFLFIHAVQDDYVGPEHARMMHDAVQAAGLTTKLVIEDAHTHSPTLDGELISEWLKEQVVSE
jgi:acetyl esterase/lipase